MSWPEWAGIRDILIHANNRVNPEEVWNTLEDNLPKLLEFISQ
jgi:hypothetical protein